MGDGGLGRRLGGPGTEWLLHGAAHGAGGSWDLQAGLRARYRFSQNSFAPYREGRALGGFLEGRLGTGLPGGRLAGGRLDLCLQLDGERLKGGEVVGRLEGGARWRRQEGFPRGPGRDS